MMTFPETHRDLLGSDVAILATVGENGYPQVTAIWFLFDEDGTLKVSLNGARQKTKNLQVHPECSFFILDRANPYRTLEVRARAELSLDPDYVFADKVGRKYGANMRMMDAPGEQRFVVTLHPLKINAIDMSQR
jgi:PPOX class probable F420-dependent enzyme